MTSLPFGTDLIDIALNRLRSMRIPISSQLPKLWFLRKKERQYYISFMPLKKYGVIPPGVPLPSASSRRCAVKRL